MDEPFGALDEQTRMILGEDLSVLLSRTDKTIVFVTHSLGEAVFLADRVAVFSARPGTIKAGHRRSTSRIRASRTSSPRRNSPRSATQLYGLLHDEIRKTMARAVGAVAGHAP